MSVGCSHIVQNAVHTASGCLPVGIRSWEKSTATHIHAVHVEALEACEFTDREYEAILGHSKVKQLSLLPAVEMTVDFYFLL